MKMENIIYIGKFAWFIKES